ncbi:PREDICTED: exopolygalacturonase-like [Fragaria vesca subsp. vesca]
MKHLGEDINCSANGDNAAITVASTTSRELLTACDFDVTGVKYGGKPDYDITEALANAWKDACASTSASKVLVPNGTYKLKEASFKGPCKAPIELQVQGTLEAPQASAQLSKPDTWIEFSNLDNFTLLGGGTFDGQGQKAWLANDCHKNSKCTSIAINMRFHSVKNSLVKDVTSLNSKNFHVNIIGCEQPRPQLTFQHFTVIAPENSTNTDEIHIGRSTRVNITDSDIKTGDNCISIGDGTKQLTVTNVTCGPGHGISIGSLGKYQNSFSCLKAPSKVKISNVSFKNIRGTSSTPVAVKIACATGLPCEKVEMTDIDLKYSGNEGSITSQCSNVKPTVTRVANTLACATKP